MKTGILITLPASDDVTEYLSAFSKDIILSSRENQIAIKPLERKEVTRDNVERMIKKLDYNMIVFNGHGSPKSILGHKNEKIISADENHYLLKDRIIYARSCWSVMELGEKCVRGNKNGCFIGYRIPFMFIIDTTRATNPLKDNTARIFFETSNLIPLGLIKGHTAGDSNESSKKKMLKEITKALGRKDKDSHAIAQTLWNNYIGQEVIGNLDETLG